MKIKLYKFVDTNDIATGGGLIDTVQVMTESELRNEFKHLLAFGGFTQQQFVDFGYENNLSDPDSLSVGIIIEMLNGTADYDSKRYFVVQEIDVILDTI